MGRLQGKYILITRTSQGLGKQLALNYAREGAAGIAIVARNESDLKDVSDRPFLAAVVERMSEPSNPRGCLSTYACIEWEDLPPKAAAKVSQALERSTTRLTQTIAKGQKQGKIATRQDARSLFIFFRCS